MSRPPRARDPLKQAALQLFVERGVHATGIREIARHAKCSEAALYRHWENKERLVAALFQEHLGEVVALLDREINGQAQFPAKIRAAITAAFNLYDAQPLVFRYVLLVRHELADLIPPGTRMPQDVIGELVKTQIKDVEKAIVVSAAAMGSFLQTAEFVIYGRLPGPLARYAEPVGELVLKMIR